MYGRTDNNMCENNIPYRPWLCVVQVHQQEELIYVAEFIYTNSSQQLTYCHTEEMLWFR